jgi:cysteinyl-tRNA synthetase
MAMEELGPTIDIHGGGSDLIFPHHENEIAQSESFTGVKPFVRYWLHTGMLSLADEKSEEKMAHSLGNFVTVRSVLASGDVPGPALRLYLLSQLYRANLVFSEEPLRASVKRWRRWAETRATLVRLLDWARQGTVPGTAGPAEEALRGALADARTQFVAAMDEDFNTSSALGVLDDLVHRINDYAHGLGDAAPTEATAEALGEALATFEELSGALGIALVDAQAAGVQLTDEQLGEIERLVQERTAARVARDWPEADRIRNDLLSRYNVVIKDTPQGPTWTIREPART